jgi:site-specific DNA recombinase
MKTAAIYARVSSDQQKEDKTIASQTAALVAFASGQGYSVPAEWIVEDEGFSGATLVRPGLERIRDLVAEGQIQAVLVLSPDRLSRKYAYQVLLTEEWLRHGVETIFIKAPQSQTAEDQLLLQFQGMIAEYERAQILERSRRGKRHRAKQGEVSVLSGAPYGYRYVRKTEDRAAYYEIIETQAEVVRQVFDLYIAQALSIGAITRRLNELAVPTRKEQACWERSTIWAMLRNPAYRGMACFGKTREAARPHRDNRAVRMRGHPPRRAPRPLQETPKDQWIQIPVPALVDERTFDLAQERLQDNKKFSPRRTVEPSILQGLVHCARCGYALYRTSTRSSARKIYYYRCLGSDAWRYQGQARCSARPIRLDLLEDTVWTEVARLLEDPALIQAELTRRVEAARTSHPAKQHQDRTSRELLQAQRRIERLLTAYQEDLISLEDLRRRMPELRQRETRLKAELESLNAQLVDQATYLRLAHTLGEFLERLRTQAQGLNVLERQRVVRLLVKEIVVGDDDITIRHTVPNSNGSTGGPTAPLDPGVPKAGGDCSGAGSLLRTWRDGRALRNAASPILGLGRACLPSPIVAFLHGAFQPHLDQMQHPPVHDAPRERQHEFGVRNGPEVVGEVGVYDFRMASEQRLFHLDHRLLGIAARPVGVLLWRKVGFEDRLQHQHRCCHAHPITHGRDAQWPEFAVGLRDEHSSDWCRSVGLLSERKRQFTEPPRHAIRLDVREVLTIHTRRALVRAALSIGVHQNIVAADLVVQRVEAEARLCLRFRVQRHLQLLNTFRSC